MEKLALLGGEPFEPQNQEVLTPFLKRIKETYPEKTIWCYTGYLFDDELLGESRAKTQNTKEMLSYIDVLVDGEFHEEEKDLSIRFRGSRNQRIIDVSESLKKVHVFGRLLHKSLIMLDYISSATFKEAYYLLDVGIILLL